MRKTISVIAFAMSIAVINTSCNKTKTNSKRLDGGEWNVTELSVDGVNEAELPHLKFSECDAYDETCTGDWTSHEGGKGNFAWQFREKGETFEISNQSELSGDHATDEAILQCQNFSGVYEVMERTKKNMEFKTTKALGFVGQSVIIKMEKE